MSILGEIRRLVLEAQADDPAKAIDFALAGSAKKEELFRLAALHAAGCSELPGEFLGALPKDESDLIRQLGLEGRVVRGASKTYIKVHIMRPKGSVIPFVDVAQWVGFGVLAGSRVVVMHNSRCKPPDVPKNDICSFTELKAAEFSQILALSVSKEPPIDDAIAEMLAEVLHPSEIARDILAVAEAVAGALRCATAINKHKAYILLRTLKAKFAADVDALTKICSDPDSATKNESLLVNGCRDMINGLSPFRGLAASPPTVEDCGRCEIFADLLLGFSGVLLDEGRGGEEVGGLGGKYRAKVEIVRRLL